MNPVEEKILRDTHVSLERMIRGVIYMDDQQQPTGQRGEAVEHWRNLDKEVRDQLDSLTHEKRS